ncbi:hypothetical protein BDW66DRAFT_136602 [Aspergillus desertorum]
MIPPGTSAGATPSASAPQNTNANANAPVANTNATLTGTCPCGSISITVVDAPLGSQLGRKGSDPNITIDASKTALQDRRQTLKMYFDLDMLSGRQIEKFFCSSCGWYVTLRLRCIVQLAYSGYSGYLFKRARLTRNSPVMSMTALLPGQVNLTMGLFPRIPASGFETSSSAFQPHRHQHLHPYAVHSQSRLDDAAQWSAKASAGLA